MISCLGLLGAAILLTFLLLPCAGAVADDTASSQRVVTFTVGVEYKLPLPDGYCVATGR